MNGQRRRLLSLELFDATGLAQNRQFFYLDIGCSIKVIEVPAEIPEFGAKTIGMLTDPVDGRRLLSDLRSVSEEILLLNCFDFLYFESNLLWPQCLFQNVLAKTMRQFKPEHDISKRAYVSGLHPYAAVAVHTFLKIGHPEVVWVSNNPEALTTIISQFKKKHFTGKIIPIKDSELTVQLENGTVLLNTVNENEMKETVEDLAYLNFVRHPGLIIDLGHHGKESILTSEARISNYLILEFDDLMAEFEFYLLTQIKALPNIKIELFKKKWRSILGNKS